MIGNHSIVKDSSEDVVSSSTGYCLTGAVSLHNFSVESIPLNWVLEPIV